MNSPKKTVGNDQLVVYKRENAGPATIYRQFLRDEEFIDAKLASKYEPNLILQAHRIVLASSSKFLHRKFKKNPNPKDVILVEAVEHKHLNFFIQYLYEGEVKIPEDDQDLFEATLRALDVRSDAKPLEGGGGDMMGEEPVTSSSAKVAQPSPFVAQPSAFVAQSSPKVAQSAPFLSQPSPNVVQNSSMANSLSRKSISRSSSECPGSSSESPKETASDLTESTVPLDVKPDMKIFNNKVMGEDFMARVTKGGSKRLFIEEFPEASSGTSSTSRPPSSNSSGGTGSSTVPKKPRVIENPKLPAINRSEIGKPVKAQMGLFWLEQNNPNLKTKDELSQQNRNINFKELLVRDDLSKAYFGFENQKDAKNFVDNAIVTNPDKLCHPKVVIDLPLQYLRPPSRIERKIKIEGVPKSWPGVASIDRMLKKNKIKVNIGDISFNKLVRQAFITVYDQQTVDRTLKVVNGYNGMSASMM